MWDFVGYLRLFILTLTAVLTKVVLVAAKSKSQ